MNELAEMGPISDCYSCLSRFGFGCSRLSMSSASRHWCPPMHSVQGEMDATFPTSCLCLETPVECPRPPIGYRKSSQMANRQPLVAGGCGVAVCRGYAVVCNEGNDGSHR